MVSTTIPSDKKTTIKGGLSDKEDIWEGKGITKTIKGMRRYQKGGLKNITQGRGLEKALSEKPGEKKTRTLS